MVEWRDVTVYKGGVAHGHGKNARVRMKLDPDGKRHQEREYALKRNSRPGVSKWVIRSRVDRMIAEAVVCNPDRREQEGAA